MVNLARKERADAVEAGRRDAERLKAEILDEARKQREQLLKQAETQIQAGIRQARAELSGEAADLAIRAAGEAACGRTSTTRRSASSSRTISPSSSAWARARTRSRADRSLRPAEDLTASASAARRTGSWSTSVVVAPGALDAAGVVRSRARLPRPPARSSSRTRASRASTGAGFFACSRGAAPPRRS